MSLRVIVLGSAAAMAVVVVAVSTALVVLTSLLHRESAILRDAVASVTVAEKAQVTLLLLDRATEPRTREGLAQELRGALTEAHAHVTSRAEGEALEEARAGVLQYLAALGSPGERRLDAAYGGLQRMVNVNVAQADRAQQQASRWDRVANAVGLGAGVLMLAVLAGLVRWIWRSALLPLYSIAGAVERFGAGDLQVRAPEVGATELRAISAQFNRMTDALAREQEARLTYLAGVAHDLRNPLAALQMSTSLIDPEHPLADEARVRRATSAMRRQIAGLNRMVGDLLDATRIEAGHLELRLEELDLREVVRGVVELFAETSALHEVRAVLPDEPLHVRGDPLRLGQTLSNLVSNAIKYSPAGGEVRVEALREQAEALVVVTDQGIGIAPEDLPHLWEPFHRAGAAAGMVPGVGLGLSVARRIIHAHQGELTVESTPGVGSTFCARIPLSTRRQVAPSPVHPGGQDQPGPTPT